MPLTPLTTWKRTLIFNVEIPVTPVPAARPRVPRYGKPFYVGKYRDFRSQMDVWVAKQQPTILLECPLFCRAEFICKRPAKPARIYPIGDIDNYLKAIWDSLQGRLYFKDDKQIESVYAIKRYSLTGNPRILLTFEET